MSPIDPGGRSGRPRPHRPPHRLKAAVAILAVVSLLAPGAASAIDVGDGPGASSTDSAGDAPGSVGPGGRSIVVLRDRPGSGAERARRVDRTVHALERRLSLRADHVYRHTIRGFSAVVDAAQLRALRSDPDVAYVAPDRPMTLTSQPLPLDFARVNADVAPMTHYDGLDQATPGDGQRIDADIAVLDTGVDGRHPDLNVAGGVDCSVDPRGGGGHISGDPAWGDVLGHGTHVAGIAAALDNRIGRVGIAPGARIWSVRIFGSDIRGWTSNLLCGIDWVTAQRDPATDDHPERPLIEVANMSMRVWGSDDGDCGRTNHDPVHAAICASVVAGNVYAVAAGNERNDAAVYIPASYDEVITVSALADFDGKPGGHGIRPPGCTSNANGVPDVDDTFADFSTHGHDVDLIAPGVCVFSTYPIDRGNYRTLSGTSMATPVVAGAVALYRTAVPDASPEQVRAALVATGNLGWATQTDPDGTPEPLVDVASAGAPADFRLGVVPRVAAARPGTTTSFAVEVHRTFAFGGDVTLAVDTAGLPPGVTAQIAPTDLPGFADDRATVTLTIPAGTADAAGSFVVRATASGPGVERSVTTASFVDSLPPQVTPPIATFPIDSAPGVDVPLRLSWTGADVSGTQRYSLEEQADTAAWQPIGAPSIRATGLTHWVAPGGSYAYRVRAVDSAGNEAIAEAPAVRLRVRSEDSPRIVYDGAWSRETAVGAYGGSVRFAVDAGASATVRFTARAIAWLSPKSAVRGLALVFVDDEATPVTVDLASPTPLASRVVFARDWPAIGRHTVRIQVVGTEGRRRVDLDEILTLR